MPRLSTTLLFATTWVGCSSSLPAPPTGPHPSNAAIVDVVEYPPPPAESELVPPAPNDASCVWLDGHWEWIGRRWQWTSGAWIVPPKGCYYAPPSMYWVGEELSYLRAHWFPEDSEEMPAEKARNACGKPVPCGRPAEKYKPGR